MNIHINHHIDLKGKQTAISLVAERPSDARRQPFFKDQHPKVKGLKAISFAGVREVMTGPCGRASTPTMMIKPKEDMALSISGRERSAEGYGPVR
jgi:hypothetical protein